MCRIGGNDIDNKNIIRLVCVLIKIKLYIKILFNYLSF
jgi:hypothetical protein